LFQRRETELFTNYYRGEQGKKRDWSRAWMNWLLKSQARQHDRAPAPSTLPAGWQFGMGG
jgi:hypothetical protein